MSTTSPLDALLRAYRPQSEVETADVKRVRAMLSTEPDPWRRSSSLHITGSALVVHPPTRRVLLRWHVRQQGWLQIGGHADPGELDPLAIALREGAEETGLVDLTPWPDSSLLHVVVVPVGAGGQEVAHEHADLRFLLATEHPQDAVPENPAARLSWQSVPKAREMTAEANLRESLSRLDEMWR